MKLKKSRFLVGLLLTVIVPGGLGAQSVTPEAIKQIMNNQPDYVADYTVTTDGETIKMRLARKGKGIRQEIMPVQNAVSPINEQYRYYKIISLNIPGAPALALDPQEKSYTELPGNFRFPAPDIEDYFRTALRHGGKVSGSGQGEETIDGHKARKIRIRFDSSDEAIVYVATGLKDLIVKMEGKGASGPTSFAMSNISLDVPESLLEVPKEYKRVDFSSFMATMRQRIVK